LHSDSHSDSHGPSDSRGDSDPHGSVHAVAGRLDKFVKNDMKRSLRDEPPEASLEDLKLKATEEGIENANLLPPPEPGQSRAERERREHLVQLNTARELRRNTNTLQAIVVLVRLLESRRVPMDIKSEALFELGIAAQQEEQYVRAQQIFSHFVHRFQDDPKVPEALLRQGVIQRDMGAKSMALSKFYAVLSTALKIPEGRIEHYQRLVLKAQTEIADTHFAFGDYATAADFYERLKELGSTQLDKGLIHFKQVRSYWRAGDYASLVGAAREYLSVYPEREEVPEVRYLLASSLKRLGRSTEALDEVFELLSSQQALAGKDRARWVYWQQRTGNTIANELYQEGDYLSALEIYLNLARLNKAASWQLPVWYQTGLIYERLRHTGKARQVYRDIVARKDELGPTPPPSLAAIVEMAEWRANFLGWQMSAEKSTGRIIGNQPIPEK